MENKSMGKAQKLKEQRKIERIIQEKEQKKKKKKREIIITIIVVVLLVAVGNVFYFFRLEKQENIIRATIETDKGDIKLELYKDAAPKTVDNFVKLAKEEFYDGTTFHRVVEDFVIQGGDPLSKDDDPSNDGTGGPGYVFDDEINPKSLGLSDEMIKQLEAYGYTFDYSLKSISHEQGAISMANAGPNTNGSQFFIVTVKDQPDLDGRHTVFGKVIEGMEIVQEIEQNDIMKVIIND